MTKLHELLTAVRDELSKAKDVIKCTVEFMPSEIIVESHVLYKPNGTAMLDDDELVIKIKRDVVSYGRGINAKK